MTCVHPKIMRVTGIVRGILDLLKNLGHALFHKRIKI